ncbi:MAG: amidohydrolase family protein [Pirellulaceae bacterium]
MTTTQTTRTADRRHFIRSSAAATGGALAASCDTGPLAGLAWADESNSADMPRVDTHLHCFAGDRDERFPYHARAPYKPAEAATPEHLLHCMDGARIDYAIVVHPEPYQDDHRYLEHCLQIGKGRLKGTLLLFADRPGSVAKLPELAKRLDVVATRVHAYAPDRLPPFGKPELRDYWRAATEAGLAMQLHFEPRWAEGFEPLIADFRDTRVIIDHLGRPLQGTPDEHERVIRWARFPNTVMKISSLPETRSYPHRDIRPIVKRLVEAYGPDRCIYGGGFGAGATPASYRAAFDRAQSLLSHLSPVDQDKILGGNAKRLFRFG